MVNAQTANSRSREELRLAPFLLTTLKTCAQDIPVTAVVAFCLPNRALQSSTR